jgi:parvulin-like peptidyl-prolyl isomerase
MKFSVVVLSAVFAASSFSAQTKPAAAKAAGTKPAKVKARTPAPAAAKTPAPVAPATPATNAESGSGKVVMQVGTESLTAAEFDSLIESLPEQVKAQAKGPMKRQMAEQIVRVKLLAQQARKKGLDKEKNLQAQIQFQTENLLARAAFNEINKGLTIEEPALRKYYDEHKNEYERVTARHILVKFKGSPVPQREGKPELTEEQALARAQELRAKLLAGGDFAAIAKEESDDTGSGQNGGELGTFSRGQMVGEFDKAAFSLPVGQVSEPTKTQFGYHLILVDKRESRSFEDVRTEIEDRLKPEAAGAAVEKLRKEASVTLDEAYFGPASPTPPAAPADAPAPASAAPSPAPAK